MYVLRILLFVYFVWTEVTTACAAVTNVDRFTHADLYPCSSSCSSQRVPCPACLHPPSPLISPSPPHLYRERSPSDEQSQSPPSTPLSQASSRSAAPPLKVSTACRFPRQPLRLAYILFLRAVRERFIDDMSKSKTDRFGRSLKRFGDGLIMGSSLATNEWGSNWECHSEYR